MRLCATRTTSCAAKLMTLLKVCPGVQIFPPWTVALDLKGPGIVVTLNDAPVQNRFPRWRNRG